MVSMGGCLSMQSLHFLYIRISKYTKKQKQEEEDKNQEWPNPFSLSMGVNIAVSLLLGIPKTLPLQYLFRRGYSSVGRVCPARMWPWAWCTALFNHLWSHTLMILALREWMQKDQEFKKHLRLYSLSYIEILSLKKQNKTKQKADTCSLRDKPASPGYPCLWWPKEQDYLEMLTSCRESLSLFHALMCCRPVSRDSLVPWLEGVGLAANPSKEIQRLTTNESRSSALTNCLPVLQNKGPCTHILTCSSLANVSSH